MTTSTTARKRSTPTTDRQAVHAKRAAAETGTGPVMALEGFRLPSTAVGHWWAVHGNGSLQRGVYRDAQRMTDLPHVLDVIERNGKASYRLCMDPEGDGPTVRVYRRDLTGGEWGISLDIPLPSDKKLLDIVATAVIFEGKALGRITSAIPRWTEAGRLEMPPTDILPRGYGVTVGTEAEARKGWADIARRAARHPKLALVLGAGMFSPFVRPLGRQSHILHAAGEARQGKTTAQTGAAALMGFPGTPRASGTDERGLITLWSNSIPGLAYALGDLGTLPTFRDELGASGLTPTKLEEVVFLVAQGGQRTTATRYTKEAETSALWGGTLFSTGNNSITGQVANPGVHARVVEVSTPIVGPAGTEEGRRDAEWFQEAFLRHYGWPLHWLRSTVDPEDAALAVGRAERDLPLPVGGVPRTLGQHLAGAIAGAGLLDGMTGAGELLRPAAIEAARSILDSAEGSGGDSQGTLLLEAILSAMVDRPSAWPTKETYERLTADSGEWRTVQSGVPSVGMDRKVEGVQWPDGSAVVSKETMTALASAAGLTEPAVALRELRDRDLLVICASQRKAKKLENALKLNGRKVRRYQVRFPEAPDADDDQDQEQEQTGPDDGDGGPESPQGPCDGGGLTCTRCGQPMTADLYGDGMHASCAPALASWPAGSIGEQQTAAPAPAPETPAATVPAPRAERAQSTRATGWVCVYTPEALTAPDGTELAGAVSLADALHAAAEATPSGTLAQVLIDPAANKSLRIARRLPVPTATGKEPKEPAFVSELRAAGWGGRSADGSLPVRAWNIVQHADRPGTLVHVIVRHWLTTDGGAWGEKDEASTAWAARIARVSELTGFPWGPTGGKAAADLHVSIAKDPAGRRYRHWPKWQAPGEDWRKAVGHRQDCPNLHWTAADGGEDFPHRHQYDARYNYLASYGEPRALDALTETGAIEFTTARDGMWQVERSTWDRLTPPPWAAMGGDGTGDGPLWVTTSVARLMQEQGLPVTVLDSWTAERHPLPGGEEFVTRVRDALAVARAEGDDVVEQALKGHYRALYGYWRRGPYPHRPDWFCAVKTESAARLLRKVYAVEQATGRTPLQIDVDGVVYGSQHADPLEDVPPLNGKRPVIGDGLGQFKVKTEGE